MAVVVCRKMHWTYQDYLAQPVWFVQNIVMTISQENHLKNLRNKQQSNG